MSLLPSYSPAILALADGTVFKGLSIGADGVTSGEVVFNTAITGYQEILTDPSYSRQIVTLTYPHIGNVGCNAEDFESKANYAAGLVIRDLPLRSSSWREQSTLPAYLKKHGVPAIAGIDTRKLTRILREKGRRPVASLPVRLMKPRRWRWRAPFPVWLVWILPRWSPSSRPTNGATANGRCRATSRGARLVSMSWPTILVSSTTSCACWRLVAAS